MGDRGNIVVKFPDGEETTGIFFYSHWRGSELPVLLWKALKSFEGRNRWNDAPYLARIIFNYIQGNDRGETGFGISPYETDNEHELIYVDPGKQTVSIGDKSWSFKEYTDLSPEEIPKI